MTVLKDIFYDRACAEDSPFSKTDVKILFCNLLDIIDLELKFVSLLESAAATQVEAAEDAPDKTTIGQVFRQMVSSFLSLFFFLSFTTFLFTVLTQC